MLIRSLLPPGFLREHKHLPCALPLQLCFPTPNQQNKCVTRSVTCRGHSQICKKPGKGAAPPTTFHSQTPQGTSILLQETMSLERGCTAWLSSLCAGSLLQWCRAPSALPEEQAATIPLPTHRLSNLHHSLSMTPWYF